MRAAYKSERPAQTFATPVGLLIKPRIGCSQAWVFAYDRLLMLGTTKLRFEPIVLVDYMTAGSPLVTAVRGSLGVGVKKLLGDTGHYERYLALLPEENRDTAKFALAASWVPAEQAMMHCETVDALQLDDKEVQQMGQVLGGYILDSLFASVLRAARSAGADAGAWICLKHADRVWNRVYQGGGVSVIQAGPKDAVIEVHGLPFAASPAFRVMHCAFLRGIVMLVARTCVAKVTRAREARDGTLAVALSWV
jgi:hypothetical protein